MEAQEPAAGSAAPAPTGAAPAAPAAASNGSVAEIDDVATAVPGLAPGLNVRAVTGRGARLRWVIGGTVALLAVAGAIVAAAILSARPLPEALRYLPSDSVIVVELRPDLPGNQRQSLGNLLAHFPGFADQSTLTAKLDEALGRIVKAASNGSVDYMTRIKPLLTGPLVMAMDANGLGLMTSAGKAAPPGLIVATTDGSVTCDVVFGSSTVLETYRGITIRSLPRSGACAVDGRFVLVGDSTSIRAGIDAHIDHAGVDTNARFTTARARLADDQLGIVFLDGKAMSTLVRGAAPSAGLGPAAMGTVADWMIAGLHVVNDAVQLDVQTAPGSVAGVSSGAPTKPPPATSQFAPLLPADTYGFVEVHGAGANLQRGLAVLKLDASVAPTVTRVEQALGAVGGIQNVAAWIEDLGVAAVPTGTTVGGVVLLRGADAATVASRLAQLHNLLVLASTGTDITVHDADHAGVTVTTVDLGDLSKLLSGLAASPSSSASPVSPGISLAGQRLVFSMARRDSVLILAVGNGVVERILDTNAATSLGTTETYRRAASLAGSPSDIEAYVALDSLTTLMGSNPPAGLDITTWTTNIKPYLEHLAGFGEGSLSTDTGGTSRFVITVK